MRPGRFRTDGLCQKKHLPKQVLFYAAAQQYRRQRKTKTDILVSDTLRRHKRFAAYLNATVATVKYRGSGRSAGNSYVQTVSLPYPQA